MPLTDFPQNMSMQRCKLLFIYNQTKSAVQARNICLTIQFSKSDWRIYVTGSAPGAVGGSLCSHCQPLKFNLHH